MLKPTLQAGYAGGFTLLETLLTGSVLSVVTAAVFIGSMTLQRSFRASDHYSQSQAAQTRLLDYVALDLRRAVAVSVPSAGRINISIPDYYDNAGNPRNPAIYRDASGRLGVRYGSATRQIAYYVDRPAGTTSGKLLRVDNGVSSTIAEDVRDFDPTFSQSTDAEDQGQQVFKLSVTFVPKYQWSGNGSSAREGTRISTRILLRNKQQR